MDTAALQAFRTTAQLGSVTAAARALEYTQSAVSRQIAVLESAVGVRLFDRRARGVELTEYGRSFLPHAEALLDRLDAAQHDLEALDRLEQGHLRIGAFPTAVAVLVPRAMRVFRARHPGVSLSLRESATERQLPPLLEGAIDIAVVSALSGQTLDREQLELTHLFDDVMLIAVPRTHRLARRRSLRLDQLADERWIGAVARDDDDRALGPEHLGLTPPPPVDFVVRGWTAKLGLVAAGLGITPVPSLAADAVRGDVALVGLHAQDARTRGIYAATVKGRTEAPATREFLGLLKHSARQTTRRQR